MKWLARIEQIIEKFTGWLADLLLVAVLVIISLAILLRFAFDTSVIWGIEVPIELLLIAVFLTMGPMVRTGGHVKIDILLKLFSQRVQNILALITNCAGLAFGIYLAWIGYSYVPTLKQIGLRLQGAWDVPQWPFYLILPSGMVIMSIFYLGQVLRAARRTYAADEDNVSTSHT